MKLSGNDIVKGLGVAISNGQVYLYYISSHDLSGIDVASSDDGFAFEKLSQRASIVSTDGQPIGVFPNSHLKISTVGQRKLRYMMQFKNDAGIFQAGSKDLLHWVDGLQLSSLKTVGAVVSDYKIKEKNVLYYGDTSICIAYSKDKLDWKTSKLPLLYPRPDYFDNGILEVENAVLTEKGILVIYHSKSKEYGKDVYKVGIALFNKEDPEQLLWRSKDAVWSSTDEWRGQDVRHIGTIQFRDKIISYWNIDSTRIYAVVYSFLKQHISLRTKNISLDLKKVEQNPILSPQTHNSWEAFNTFNAATVFHEGKIHIFYRAQGYDYVSVIGYASSNDGVTIDERLDEPVFTSPPTFQLERHDKPNYSQYASGGGYGGCEDPRMTIIDNRLYMVYVSYDGMTHPRLAMTSISLEDFLNKRWFWEKPVLISPPGIVDKSGCILPEKINGKYVIFHRIFPNILIDYVDDLSFSGKEWLKGEYSIKIRKDMWDSRKIGAGAPPVKTKDGWLLIYYAVDERDAGRYKMGAMLLDLNDPTKVLHRTNAPILEPTENYENVGFKPGIAYPCGAVIIGETLFVYYGGADSVVCVATANLNDFLSELKYSEIAKLQPAIIHRVL